jgi:hypothetical protein
MSDRDYYEILGLTPRADGAMVDQAYWHLARKYQQMAETDVRAAHLLDELNEAYGVLGTPRLREQYDAFRDEVLVESGVLQPVTSKPRKQRRAKREPAAGGARIAIPTAVRRYWRNYATSAVIVVLALAAAWQGVAPVLLLGALAFGLAVSLTPIVTRQLREVHITFPSMPNVQLPEVHAPRVSLPSIPVDHPGHADDQADAEELRESTAALIGRWRSAVGLRAPARDSLAGGEAPSRTLLEIVAAEREVEAAEQAPLNAVADILRTAQKRERERA